MAVTIEALRERVTHMERELAEMRTHLDELAETSHQNGTLTPSPDPLAGLPFADPAELRRILRKVAPELGIDLSKPAPTAREVREMMLREGVRPEDNILSRGIIEAREE